MRLPIQYAFSYPKRFPLDGERLDLFKMKALTFEQPDTQRFRCLRLAYESLKQGGNMPCIVNAANEVANLAFRQERCGFLQMADIIEQTLARVAHQEKLSLQDYLDCDRESRIVANELIGKP